MTTKVAAMRTHVTGILIFGVCGALLGVDTLLFLSGEYRAVLILTAAFVVLVLVVALLIALVPSIADAFSTG